MSSYSYIFLMALLGTIAYAQFATYGSGPHSMVVIDEYGPKSPWGKTVGDINGDGRPDLVVGGHQQPDLSIMTRLLGKLKIVDRSKIRGELVWYENPIWRRHLISTDYQVRTDLAIGDLNADGKNDVVVPADSGFFWLENPTWAPHHVYVSKSPVFCNE